MTCRGCDAPIDSDTYCKRCLEEIESLVSAKPFVWPEWVIIARNGLFFVACILVTWYCIVQIMLDWPDASTF